MAAAAVPIFHITHVDNLASIAQQGLYCDALVPRVTTARSIAYAHIKRQRAETDVPVAVGGTLADYVPFYFCPRSPMLYTIWRGNVAGAEDAHPHIAHLVLNAERVVADGHDFAFTNGHAIMALSDFFEHLDDLDHVDWDAVRTNSWGVNTDPTGETLRKKQSEFLVHRHVPWDLVEEIGVIDAAAARGVARALNGVSHRPSIIVKRDWYYWPRNGSR